MNGDSNMKEQVLKLLNDRKFCDELLEIESESEVKEHFKKNGAEITDEELSEIKEFITAMEKELKKLDNNILKEISGGVGEDEGNGGSPKAVSAAAGQQKFTVEQANQWLDFFGRLLNLGKDPAKFFVNSYSSAKKDECNGERTTSR